MSPHRNFLQGGGQGRNISRFPCSATPTQHTQFLIYQLSLLQHSLLAYTIPCLPAFPVPALLSMLSSPSPAFPVPALPLGILNPSSTSSVPPALTHSVHSPHWSFPSILPFNPALIIPLLFFCLILHLATFFFPNILFFQYFFLICVSWREYFQQIFFA